MAHDTRSALGKTLGQAKKINRAYQKVKDVTQMVKGIGEAFPDIIEKVKDDDANPEVIIQLAVDVLGRLEREDPTGGYVNFIDMMEYDWIYRSDGHTVVLLDEMVSPISITTWDVSADEVSTFELSADWIIARAILGWEMDEEVVYPYDDYDDDKPDWLTVALSVAISQGGLIFEESPLESIPRDSKSWRALLTYDASTGNALIDLRCDMLSVSWDRLNLLMEAMKEADELLRIRGEYCGYMFKGDDPICGLVKWTGELRNDLRKHCIEDDSLEE